MDISKYKVGDKVRVTKRHSENYAEEGMEGYILDIDLSCPLGIYFNVEIIDSYGGRNQSWCEGVSLLERGNTWQDSKLIFRFR
jgi:hypothetical protein